MPDISPVSPKAFEFVKYTQIPISKYTGVPSISIPIYTIKTNGIDIPINLEYHSNGFRVAEEAGWTGLGWNLNGGGSIVQIVNGFDDFSTWFQKAPDESQALVDASVAAGSGIPSSILNTGANVNFTLQSGGGGSVDPGYGILNYNESANYYLGKYDYEVDDFIFNMPGHFGEFVLDWKTNTFRCLTDKNITVTSSGIGSGFTIRTPDGNIFVFGQIEETITAAIARYGMGNTPPIQEVNLHLPGERTSRTFQLTHIYTIGGDEIDFNYVQTPVLENLPSVSVSEDFYTEVMASNPAIGCGDANVYWPNNGVNTTINYTHQAYSYLSSITFPQGTVKFYTSNNRTDCIGALRLDSVALMDNNTQWVNSFKFNYDYFAGRTDGNNADSYLSYPNAGYTTNKQPSELANRLKLTSVQEAGKHPYIFGYDPQQLPKKTSYATDYWGYFNKHMNNVDYMPNIYMSGVSDPNIAGINNDHNSNLNGTRAAVLNQVIYPTGGVSTFDYELNSFSNYKVPTDNSSKVSSIYLQDTNNPVLDNTGQIFMGDLPSVLYAGTLSFSTDGAHGSYTSSTSAYIRLTILKKTAANLALVNSPSTFWPMYNATRLGSGGTQLSSEVNDVVQDLPFFNPTFNTTTQSYNTSGVLNNAIINLDPANIYIVQAYLDDSWGIQNSSTAHASTQAYFTFLQNMNYTTSVGAGLRIKTIKSLDVNSPPIVKSYTYSGGKLMSPLIYLTKYKYDFRFVNNIINDCPDTLQNFEDATVSKTSTNSSSFYPISTNASGKYVGYDAVEESNSTINITGDLLNNNGKIVDTYTNQPDQIAPSLTFVPSATNPEAYNPVDIFYPPQKNPIENGLVSKEQIFDKNQTLIQEVDNNYINTVPLFYYNRITGYDGQYYKAIQDHHLYEPLSGGCVQNNVIWVYVVYNVHYYAVAFAAMNFDKTLLGTTIKTLYSAGNPVTSTQINYYDTYDQLNKTVTTDSQSNTVNTYFKHPYDFSSSDDGGLYGGFNQMMMSNFFEPVIETWSDKNGIKTFDSKTLFNFNSGSLWPVFEPQKTQSSISNNGLEDNIIYDLYGSSTDNNKFKLLQYHVRDNGVNTSIFWGYKGQYPVAKVVGADYNTAKAFINQSVLDNPTDDNTLRTEINKIKTGLANAGKTAQVTTYTYAPLKGVTSETAPTGLVTYYNYDNLGRLYGILDNNKNYLKEFSYNYATPATVTPVAVNATNSTNTTWVATISNNQNTYNQSATLSIGTSTPFASIPAGTYNITVTPTAGASSAYAQLAINGHTYSSGNFTLYNVQIGSTTNFALTSVAGYTTNLSFTYAPGFTNAYTNFETNGSSVYFSLAFNTTVQFTPNNPILIGNVSSGGIPAAARNIPFTNNGNNWIITIDAAGHVYLTYSLDAGPSVTGTIATVSPYYYSL